MDLRVNRLKASFKEVHDLFLNAGLSCKPIKDCPYGLEVAAGSGDLTNWPGYEEGLWSVQDRAAQWIAPLLESSSGVDPPTFILQPAKPNSLYSKTSSASSLFVLP